MRLAGVAGLYRVVHLVELEVLAQDAVVKAEVKGLQRLRLGIEPQDDLRLIDLQQRFGRQVQAGGAGHLARGALDADELIPLEDGRLKAEDRPGDILAGVVAAVGAGVILAAGLEIHALVLPAHGPVDLPGQLAVEVFGKIKGAVMAAVAFVLRHVTVVRQGQDLRGVLFAHGAVDGDGIIGLPLPFLRVLRAVGIEDIEDLAALAQGL